MNARGWLALVLAAAAFGGGLAIFLPLSEGAPDAVPRVSDHYIEHAVRETGAANIVSAVLLDYRAFDTLGEAVVILAAALAVGALLGHGRLPAPGRGLSILVRRTLSFLTPLFLLLPAYIVANGHLSPGGGFQGGVAWATLLMLLAVVYGTGAPQRLGAPDLLPKIEYAGAGLFLAIGLYGLLRGGAFLANRAAGFPLGAAGTLPSAGSIPWLNLAIGAKVMAGMAAIFFYLQRDEETAP